MPFVYFILLLSALVFFHELGHFLLAKLFKVKVLTFSIGFGPALLKKTLGDTQYKIALIPLGGYVKMYGDEPNYDPKQGRRASKPGAPEGSSKEPEATPDTPITPEDPGRAFNAKPLWQRSLIVLAGPVFNLILPFIIYFLVFSSHADMVPARIGEAIDGGPAAKAGIRSGDRVVEIDGQPIHYWWELEEIITRSPDRDVDIVVERSGSVATFKVPVEGRDEIKLPHVNLTDREGRIHVVPVHARPEVWVRPNSSSHQAGLRTFDRIAAVDGLPVESFGQFMELVSDGREHALTILRESPVATVGHARLGTLAPPFDLVLPAGGNQDLRSAQMAVQSVDPDSPAEQIGLTPGAVIVSLDGYGFPFWYLMEMHLKNFVDVPHDIVWEDAAGEHKAQFTLTAQTEKGELKEDRQVVIFGAYNTSSFGTPASIPNDHRLGYAAHFTWTETMEAYRITLHSIAGLVRGQVPMKEMGGPILIYDMAAKTEQYGWEYFFRMMVWLSLSLGFINLFPVPILDGGHLLFFGIEAAIRHPIPIRVREIASLVGLILIAVLMIVVFKNDIMRNWGNFFGVQ